MELRLPLKTPAVIGALLILTLWQGRDAIAGDAFIARSDVQAFVRDVAKRHNLNRHEIASWFTKIESQPDILKAISTPAERVLQWYEYRAIFLTEQRIKAGRDFLAEHRELLDRAEAEFGVPATIIVAVIGVETFYGRQLGKHNAIEALATLGFDFPRRSKFFKQELEEFILLVGEENWDPSAIQGSYAAAMGMPQFISSSYRRYAIDFDADGQRDLWNSVPDVIGSVANYLAEHGWRKGEPITVRWQHASDLDVRVNKLVRKELKPAIASQTLSELGFKSSGKRFLSVNRLKQKKSTETWIGFTNFYVITRYNHSRLYAMAVNQLSESLQAAE